MDIRYLQQMSRHRSITDPNSGYVRTIRPLTMEQIEELEQQYNSGRPFPAALRELLYLAGDDCYVLDYGRTDTQQEMQEDARSWMKEFGLDLNIPRPFYVVDTYNAGDQFLFVYLDEGRDDPTIHEALMPDEDPGDTSWIRNLGYSLSTLINLGIDDLLKGYNPF